MLRPHAPRTIKKYSNRRLYDTAESRYVTLEELAESVRTGVDVRVLDAQTGDDLTQATLAQIILEGRGAAQFLSVPILTQLVRMNDDALADFFSRWVSAALELYQNARQGVQALTPYNPMAAMPLAAGNMLSRLMHMMPGPWMPGQTPPARYPVDDTAAPHEVPPPAGPPVAMAPADAASVDALRRELDELKRSLHRSAATEPSARSPKKSSKHVKK
jgi:polyhydroxyalkanoate synthesis repressor PhaR